jgi:hypothetical protein
MVEGATAAVAAGADLTLHLYLTANDPAYLGELREQVGRSGGAVTVHDPVPYAELLTTLHAHDVGVHVLPPVSFNNTHALPNKIFDYVQARLALVVGPSPEMADLVRRHGLGVVADGFDPASLTAALLGLDAAHVTRCKEASHAAARALSDVEQSRRWVDSVRAIAEGTAGLVEEPL